VEYYITMNTKTSLVFGIIAVAAAVLLFAAVSGVTTHQAWATAISGNSHSSPGSDVGQVLSGVKKILSEPQTQLDRVGLGDVCLSCWGG
jgi:hypothetical protein